MQGVPPVDRFVDDGNIHHADNRENACSALSVFTVLIGIGERYHAQIEKKQNQHRRDACVPFPPGAPSGFSPDRASDECDEGECCAEWCGRAHGPECEFHAPDESDSAGDGHEVITSER